MKRLTRIFASLSGKSRLVVYDALEAAYMRMLDLPVAQFRLHSQRQRELNLLRDALALLRQEGPEETKGHYEARVELRRFRTKITSN